MIGRSPDMPRGHRHGCPPLPALDGLRRRAQRRRGVDDVSGQALELTGLAPVDTEVVQLHLGLGPSQRGGALERADVVVLVDQIQDLARDDATMVQKSTRAVAPGAIRTRRRSAKIGSSTAPVVPESGGQSIIALARATPPPRPRKRARSVSNSRLPTASPSTTARCAAQISVPSVLAAAGARRSRLGRRDARSRRTAWRRPDAPRRRLGRQHQLGVGGHLDLARADRRGWRSSRGALRRRPRRRPAPPSVVASVPSRRDELGAILVECDLVAVGLGPDRL